jgi:polar amino acid transport system substrate-binding protein
MSIFRFLKTCVFISIYGIAFSSAAATPITVKLYLPDNFDANAKQIPNTRQLTELFNYFERAGGLKFVIVTLPWKRAQMEVLQGQGIIYGFSKSTERLAHYHFSQPVITLQMWAISYGANNSHLSEIADLKGKTVTSGLGLSHGVEYESAKNTVFSVHEDFVSERERFKKLMTNRNNLMFKPFAQQFSRQQVDNFIHSTLIPGFKDPELDDQHFNISINPIFYDTIHFASGIGHFDDVIQRIDSVIQKGMKNGSLAKLLQKYQ